MAACDNEHCNSTRILLVGAKCSDLCGIENQSGPGSHEGYVPGDIGIGGDDYINFEWCLECGKIQDDGPVAFPLPKAKIEGGVKQNA